MLAYSIGQVLYIIPKAKMTVVALQVSEVMSKTTRDGTRIDYIVSTSGNKSAKLDTIEGDVFENLADVKETMVQNSMSSINRIIRNAEIMASKFADHREEPVAEEQDQEESISEPEETLTKVTMPDGTVARVRLPK